MWCKRESVTITTDTSGDATAYVGPVHGRVLSVQYVKDDYTNGVDFVVTGEDTGTAIYTGTDVNASTTIYPRAGVHGLTGTALTYDGTYTVNEAIGIAGERIKIVVDEGGSAKSGTFHITLG